MKFERRCWAQVDLSALRHNFHLIKSLTPNADIMGVVKADAYGHGDWAVASLLEQEGAKAFAVSGFEEAVRLRRTGLRAPLLILGYTGCENAAALAQHHITQTVFSAAYAAELSAQAVQAGVTVDIHLKADTGMGRIGFSVIDDFETAISEMEQVCRLPGLRVRGLFTHFAAADSNAPQDKAYTAAQYTLFKKTADTLRARGCTLEVCHCCNSAGTISLPDYHGDLVRPGIILYGENPSEDVQLEGLRPVMQLKAVVSMVKWVSPGDFISYGCTFQAEKPMRLATLTIGYADGYPRVLSNCGVVSLHGKPARVTGRVCMDQMMVDVTEIPEAAAGDIATIFGDAPAMSVCEIAKAENTINYEVLCDIGRRVQRVYIDEGKEVKFVNYLETEKRAGK